jgi:hypothetical protein
MGHVGTSCHILTLTLQEVLILSPLRISYDLGWQALFIQDATPGRPRGGVAFPIEGGRWS